VNPSQGSGTGSDRRHAALVRLLEALRVAAADPESRESTLASLLTRVAHYLDWPLGHAHVYDPETGRLEPTGIWYAERPGEHTGFVEATERFRPGVDTESLLGRAFLSGEPTWLGGIGRDSSVPRWEAALEAGLGAAVAVPFPEASGGVLEFFSPSTVPLDDEALSVLRYVGTAWSRVLGLGRLEVELDRRERRYRALVDAAGDAIVSTDRSGTIESWNRAAEAMFGYRAEEVLGESLSVLLPEHQRDRHREALTRAARAAQNERIQDVVTLEGVAKDGRVFPVELTVALSLIEDRRVYVAVLRDVSQRTAVEEELRLIESATSHIRDAIVVSTTGTARRGPTILYVNAAFSRMTGYAEGEALGRSFGLLAGPDTDRALLQNVNERLAQGDPVAVELTAYRKDGTPFLLYWNATPIREADGAVRHFASIQRDVTEERRIEQALRRVDQDVLTGLANRRVLEQALRRTMERSLKDRHFRFALLFLDLDGFKAVNDAHGHVVGDQLLTAAARRLERTVRPGDTLARFGGDEFVILIGYMTDISDVVMVAERVGERLETPFDIAGEELSVAASIGVALSETGYPSPEAMISAADAAMYEAKRKGKGRVEFSDRGLYRDVVSTLALREDLRAALDRDELELRYQPLVAIASGEVVGFEALLRWRHPELGLLLPERFIPLAEESDLVEILGRWVFREASLEASRWGWVSAGRPAPLLSVNMSTRQLTAPDMVEAVRRVLDETGLAPHRLQLELSERVLAEALDSVRRRLDALRELGVAFCVHDFGSGLFPVGSLRHLHVDTIKINRMLVRQLDESAADLGLVRTIVALARSLGVKVVAEGIETERQLAKVRELACDIGQGFVFSPPVRSDEIDVLLSALPPGTPPGP
jgi:diguanylate cyclase (GGDEF)-like protein/PAS domain S-box-containing protein